MIGGSGSVAKRADSSGADMRCLTLELSRAAKRRRLERIVRPQLG